ncbi:MAG: EF-P lysine aminoacylase GenX [Candidatus Tectomicrobia bacterium]|nr:EF-P lysine aminoacylase GenX [Candidatus Tectomicrobia bacterium]
MTEGQRQAGLIHLEDESGKLAVFFKPASLTPHDRELLTLLQERDIIEIEGAFEGEVFVGQTLKIVAPSLLAEKPALAGVPDRERFRQNDFRLKRNIQLRAKMISLIRRFFEKEGFLEVETPLLGRASGMELHLDAFETTFEDDHGVTVPLYLQTSPEYFMKRLLSSGFEKIFQLCKAFRNGEITPLHNPEFTILEWYRAYASYEEIMVDTERLVAFLAHELLSASQLEYQGRMIDLSSPWERITVHEAMLKYAGIDLHEASTTEEFFRLVTKKRFSTVKVDDEWETIFFKVFLEAVEPRLGQGRPTFLLDYPISMGALAKQKESDPKVAERFEVYIQGLELGNAFTELNDPREQRKRLVREQKERKSLGRDVYPLDEQFLQALEEGIPPAGGIALGIDRLVMLFTNSRSIEEVLCFRF